LAPVTFSKTKALLTKKKSEELQIMFERSIPISQSKRYVSITHINRSNPFREITMFMLRIIRNIGTICEQNSVSEFCGRCHTQWPPWFKGSNKGL